MKEGEAKRQNETKKRGKERMRRCEKGRELREGMITRRRKRLNKGESKRDENVKEKVAEDGKDMESGGKEQ